jgi:hypothetical protein
MSAGDWFRSLLAGRIAASCVWWRRRCWRGSWRIFGGTWDWAWQNSRRSEGCWAVYEVGTPLPSVPGPDWGSQARLARASLWRPSCVETIDRMDLTPQMPALVAAAEPTVRSSRDGALH